MPGPSRVTFLAPSLPPTVGGVADHTRFLAEALAAKGMRVGFISRASVPAGGELPGPVHQWSSGSRRLLRCVQEQDPDWLWVQLSAYGYSRWGAPAHLARCLRAVRRALPHLSVAVCAHETHCQPSQLGRKGWFLSPWQRYTVGAVVRQADLVFTSLGQWQRQIINDYGYPAERVHRLAIGCDVKPLLLTPAERAGLRATLGWRQHDVVAITFGTFASQLNSLRRCQEKLLRGLESRELHRVVCIGGDGSEPPAELAVWVQKLGGPRILQVLGHQPESRIGQLLACADCAFSHYRPAILGKSTVCAAYAMAALPTLLDEDVPGESPDADGPPFVPPASWDWSLVRPPGYDGIREALRGYAQANLAWGPIAERAIAGFRAVGGGGRERGVFQLDRSK